MIDIDGLDYCRRCRKPLLLVEAARDTGRDKPTIVLETLARCADVQLICILWTPAVAWQENPPHCPCQAEQRITRGCSHGVASMRARRVYPNPTDFKVFQPAELAQWIDQIHLDHEQASCPLHRSETA